MGVIVAVGEGVAVAVGDSVCLLAQALSVAPLWEALSSELMWL